MPNASNAIEWLKQEMAPVRCLIAAVTVGRFVAQALDEAQTPEFVRRFVGTTFSIIDSGQPHAVAAAFAFGREGLIPAMFRRLVGDVRERFPGQRDTFSTTSNATFNSTRKCTPRWPSRWCASCAVSMPHADRTAGK